MTELEDLLAEGIGGAAERERTEFDRLTAPYSDCLVLFGAGKLGRTIAGKLRTLGVEPLAFADNNPKLWGEHLDGVPVLAPSDAAARFGSSAAFLITIWGARSSDRMAGHARQLRELGCGIVVPFVALLWKYPELFLPYHMIDQPRKVQQEADAIQAAYALWSDAFSRAEFIAQIKWRLRGDFDAMAHPVRQAIYFPDDLVRLSEREVFVDCGAFDGDTVAPFLALTEGKFDRAIAFEPDPTNFQQLQSNVNALPEGVRRHIELYRKATAARSGRVRFAALGTDGSAIGEGDLDVECVALDDALTSAPPPTFIKMDIEGAELDALAGARGLIAAHAPTLAICSYHRQADLWRIPLLIHSINPDYRLYLRPHAIEGWDSVCYAVRPDRK